MRTLNEKQLRPNTLQDLIRPKIHVDTYTPKVKSDSIVVLFRVPNNYDAAYDLSSFIEKLPYGIVDTEARELPDADGDYLVFVEYDRDAKFPRNLMNTLLDVNKLGQDQKYTADFYNSDIDSVPVTEENITINTRLVSVDALREFMEYSNSKLHLVEKVMNVVSSSHRASCEYSYAKELTENDLNMYLREYWETPAMESIALFGPLYEVYKVHAGLIVGRDGKFFLLK